MKKLIALCIIVALLFGISGCVSQAPPSSPLSASLSARIAVIRNLANDDATQLYLDAAVSEAHSLGLTADTFLTDGDDAKMAQLIDDAISSGYDGIILSNGKKDSILSEVQKALAQGIAIVTYDTPLGGLENVTETSQDDTLLAQLSLDALLEQTDNRPAKIVCVSYDDSYSHLNKRNAVYRDYEQKGLIETVYTVQPTVSAGEVRSAVKDTLLGQISSLDADGIWCAWDELARGAYDALLESSVADIPMTSIDISNDDIDKMFAEPDIWCATAAASAALAGRIDMRLMAIRLHDGNAPDEYKLVPSLIRSSDLLYNTRLSNLSSIVPGFSESDMFLEDWMIELRNANSKRITYMTYEGKVFDESFNELAYSGLSALSDKAHISYAESLTASDFSLSLDLELRNNPAMIWTTEGSGAPLVQKAAAENPSVMFAVIDTAFSSPLPNLTGLTFRSHEGAFLAGYIAAKTSETGHVGFVGGKNDASGQSFEYGFRSGVRYADSTVTVTSRYTSTYSDELAGARAAAELYEGGADVIFTAAGSCSTGVIEEAQRAGKWAIGSDFDQSYLAPENVLTSVLKRTDTMLEQITGDFLSGQDIGGRNYDVGLKEGAIALAPNRGNIDDAVYAQALRLSDAIVDGTLPVAANAEAFDALPY